MSTPERQSRAAQRATVCALAALALGLLVYASERAPVGVPGWFAVSGLGPWLPTGIGWADALRGNGPSFIHTFSFVLLAMAWLAKSPGRAWAAGACMWALDAALECAQGATPALSGLPTGVRVWLAGTFDAADLVAQGAGWLAAVTAWHGLTRSEHRA